MLFQLTETEMSVNWNRSNPLTITVIETEIHAKTVIETELKYIANNGIDIETEIYLITDTTLPQCTVILGWSALFNTSAHLLCRLMISFIHEKDEPTWHGYLFAVLMFVVAFVQSIIRHQFTYRYLVVGMKVNSALVASIYKKVWI